MNYAEIKYNCASNGPGVRTALYVSGCSLHCKGCFNKELWDFNAGQEYTDEVQKKILDSLKPDWISGLSILGGEPMEPKNQETISELVGAVRDMFSNKKTIWLWSGYVKHKIPKTAFTDKILDNIDILVDGPFVIEKADTKLKFRGSSNQKIINLSNKEILK